MRRIGNIRAVISYSTQYFIREYYASLLVIICSCSPFGSSHVHMVDILHLKRRHISHGLLPSASLRMPVLRVKILCSLIKVCSVRYYRPSIPLCLLDAVVLLRPSRTRLNSSGRHGRTEGFAYRKCDVSCIAMLSLLSTC